MTQHSPDIDKETRQTGYPENFENLFGSIDDESFTIPDRETERGKNS